MTKEILRGIAYIVPLVITLIIAGYAKQTLFSILFILIAISFIKGLTIILSALDEGMK